MLFPVDASGLLGIGGVFVGWLGDQTSLPFELPLASERARD